MEKIRQTYLINANIKEVYKALVDPRMIKKWSGAPAVMNDKVGCQFSLWDGEIYGKNVEIIPNKKIIQDWYAGKWKNPSRVTFSLEQKGDVTKVNLLHENVPKASLKSIKEGWEKYYLGQIRELFT